VPSGSALDFKVRTSTDGSTWSPWSTTHLKRLPEENPVGDYFASLVYASDARYVQYRATFETGGGETSPSLKRVTVTVIDSQPVTSLSESTNTLPTKNVVHPDISERSLALVNRENWGADESYRFNRWGVIWPEMFVLSKKLVVHHTATRNTYASAAEAVAEIRAIYRYHAVTQRWGDIGYTASIDKFGNIYEGRQGCGGDTGDSRAREYLSAVVVGGHDTGYNYGSAGVALLGDATQSGWPMPSNSGAMWDALASFSAFEAGRHYLRPLKTDGSTPEASDFLRSDNVWTSNMRSFSGHNETNSTACPGKPVTDLLDELRTAVDSRLTKPTTGTSGQLLPNSRVAGPFRLRILL
jgi:hypothetical protein